MEQVQIERLALLQFKSYGEERLTFGQGFQLLVGANGMGKTNLLDALYYLGMCRSYFPLRDRELVRHGDSFFRLDAAYLRAGQSERLVAKVVPGDGKVFERNQKAYDTLAAHIGQFPVVLIAPNDTQLLSGFSEERRRFLDQSLCQVDPVYLQQLTLFTRLLQQRNAWLKSGASSGADWSLLETFDEQMTAPAAYLTTRRTAYAAFLEERVEVIYKEISGGRETPGIRYQSPLLKEEWASLVDRVRSQDVRYGRTTEGPHRDDLELLLDGHPVRRFGSQGQLKSYVLALKLAQYQYIAESRKLLPLLLMDDIFDKLDHQRVTALIHFLAGDAFGQVFVSDTDATRVPRVLDEIGHPYRIFRIENSEAEALPE